MVGVIDGFRWAVLGADAGIDWPSFAVSIVGAPARARRGHLGTSGGPSAPSPTSSEDADADRDPRRRTRQAVHASDTARRRYRHAARRADARRARRSPQLAAPRGRDRDARRRTRTSGRCATSRFEVEQGERLGIIGRNGAGKSTLLKILSRITEPTRGRVAIDGRVASLLEVGTGFHPELTGRENIFLNGAILGMSRAEIARKFDEIVAFAEVEKFLDTPVKRYSSGMYVRLAFAVAAHLEPEILIVDEVLAVGDAEFQKQVPRQDGRGGAAMGARCCS